MCLYMIEALFTLGGCSYASPDSQSAKQSYTMLLIYHVYSIPTLLGGTHVFVDKCYDFAVRGTISIYFERLPHICGFINQSAI